MNYEILSNVKYKNFFSINFKNFQIILDFITWTGYNEFNIFGVCFDSHIFVSHYEK